MKFVALLNGKSIPIEIIKKGGLYHLTFQEKSFTVNAIRPNIQSFSLLVEGKSYEAGLEKTGNNYSIYFYNDTVEFQLFEARKFKASELTKKSGPAGLLKVTAPMPGKIIKVVVTENTQVSEGDSLLIMEAMKMQNELKAPKSGTVKQVHVQEGEAVTPQQVLVVLE